MSVAFTSDQQIKVKQFLLVNLGTCLGPGTKTSLKYRKIGRVDKENGYHWASKLPNI